MLVERHGYILMVSEGKDMLLRQVSVKGEGMRQVELSLEDLESKFKKHTVTCTLQCTGNRRDMFNGVKSVQGLEWSAGREHYLACTVLVVSRVEQHLAALLQQSSHTICRV